MNVKQILLSVSVSFAFTVNSQISLLNWQSKGPIPESIAKSLENFPTLTVFPISHFTNENKSLENPIFERILSSGRVLYGDAYCQKLNEVTQDLISKKCINPESKIYILKSSIAAIIAHKDIFLVTSGLISQCTHPEQLYYLIIREKEKFNLKRLKEKNQFLAKETFDDLIEDYYTCLESYETQIDEIALKTYLTAGFSPFQAVRSLDVLRFSTQPFEEIDVTNNYFGNTMYIPASFYDVTDLKGVVNTANQYGQESIRLDLEKRKNNLLKLTSNPNSDNSNPSKKFIELRNFSRLQVVEEYLIKTEYEKALYAIAVLDKEATSARNYLQIMKGYAWYGLVAQSFLYDVKRYQKKHIKNNQSESDRFFRLLNRLNSFGIAAISLRYTTDVINENPDISDEIKIIRDEIINVLAQSKRFPLDKFSKKNLIPQNLDTNSLKGLTTKYDKIDLSKSNETISIDSNEFYFFGIPDLMQDDKFLDRFNSNEVKSSFHDPTVHVTFASYKGKDISKIKSEKNLKNLEKENLNIAKRSRENTTITELTKDINTESYNLSAEINQMIMQKNNTGALDWGLLSFSHYRLNNTNIPSTNNELFYQFANKYSPRLRGVHFLGLTIIALPWAISDIFLRGNNSSLISFTFNNELKKLENYEQSALSHAWNKNSAAAQIINQILKMNKNEQ